MFGTGSVNSTNDLDEKLKDNNMPKISFNNPWYKGNTLNMEVTTIEMNDPKVNNPVEYNCNENYTTSNSTNSNNAKFNSTRRRSDSNPFRKAVNDQDYNCSHPIKPHILNTNIATRNSNGKINLNVLNDYSSKTNSIINYNSNVSLYNTGRRRSSGSSIRTNNTTLTYNNNNNSTALSPLTRINPSNTSTHSNSTYNTTNILSRSNTTSTTTISSDITNDNDILIKNAKNTNNSILLNKKENTLLTIPNITNIPTPFKRSLSATSMSHLMVPNNIDSTNTKTNLSILNRSRRGTNASLISNQDCVAPTYTILNSIFNDSDIFDTTITTTQTIGDDSTISSQNSSYLPNGSTRTLSNDSTSLSNSDVTSLKIIKQRIIEKYLKASGFLPGIELINYDNGNKINKDGNNKHTKKHHSKDQHGRLNRSIHNRGIKISLVKAANHIFLPSISSMEEEYLQRINRSNRNNNRNRSDSLGSTNSSNANYNNSFFDDANIEENESFFSTNNSNFENDLAALSSISSISNSNVDFPDASLDINSIDNALNGYDNSNIDSNARNRSASMWSYGSMLSSNTDVYQQQHSINNSLKFNFDQNSMSFFKFAVVISLEEDCELSSIHLELSSLVNTCYNDNLKTKSGDKSTKKSHSKNTKNVTSNITTENSDEFYKMGSLDWNLNNKNFNLFIPLELNSKDQIIENFSNLRQPKIFKNNAKSKRTSLDASDESSLKNDLFEKIDKAQNKILNSTAPDDSVLKPGDYIFIIPVVFSNNIPETLKYPSIKVDYLVRIATNSLERLDNDKIISSISPEKNSKTSGEYENEKYFLPNTQSPLSKNTQSRKSEDNRMRNVNSMTMHDCNDMENVGTNVTLFKKMKDRFQSKQLLNSGYNDSNSTLKVPCNKNCNTSSNIGSRTIRPGGNEGYNPSPSATMYDDYTTSTALPILTRTDSSYSKQSSVDITDPMFPISSVKSKSSKRNSAGNNSITVKKNDIYLEHPLSVVRIPPLASVSTINRPVFIDRVWDDTLSYQFSFPQKFVTLGSKIPVNIKVTPLIKNVSIKKISIGITEKIAYASKDGKKVFKETDKLLRDRFSPYFHTFNNKKKKERLLLLYELRATKAGPRALKEEIITNALNENILAYFRTPPDSKNKKGDSIIEPITIETTLDFPVHDDNAEKKCNVPYGIDDYEFISSRNVTPNENLTASDTSNSNTRKMSFAQSLFGNLSKSNGSKYRTKTNSQTFQEHRDNILEDPTRTKISVTDQSDVANYISKTNKAKRGLYLDSSNFHYIKCKHKLTFIMRVERISKDGILRQFEILVNTPIFLMSKNCTQDNLTLPSYERCGEAYYQPKEEILPTFEESINTPIIPSYLPQIAFKKPSMSSVPRTFKSNFNIDPFTNSFRNFNQQMRRKSSTISEDTEISDEVDGATKIPPASPPNYRELAVFKDE